MDAHSQTDAAFLITQLYSRTRQALASNHGDLLPGRRGAATSPRDWGNPSPEMLTGGIATTQEMRDAMEKEVA